MTTNAHPSFHTAAGHGPGCSPCEAGRYSPWSTHNCTLCSAGKYSATAAATECTACPEGSTFSSADRTSCSGCVAGKYGTGMECTRCPGGKYSADDGWTTCEECVEGKSTSNNISQIACTVCKPGRYNSNSGAVDCSSCPEEYYKQESGSTECYNCPEIACEAGEYNICGSASGFASSGTCLSCPPGKYLATGMRECSMCAEGEYSGVTGTECIACTPGRLGHPGRSFCVDCSPGKYANESKGVCSDCPSSYYQPEISKPNCTQCDSCVAGGRKACGKASSGYCTDCIPGKYADKLREMCMDCPSNYFQAGTNNASCIPCANCTAGSRTQCGKSFEGYCTIASLASMPTRRPPHAFSVLKASSREPRTQRPANRVKRAHTRQRRASSTAPSAWLIHHQHRRQHRRQYLH